MMHVEAAAPESVAESSVHRVAGVVAGVDDLGDARATPARSNARPPAAGSAAVLHTLSSLIEPVAAFCVLWPSEFTSLDTRDAVASDAVLALPREWLASAFALNRTSSSIHDDGASCRIGHWPLDRLPPQLRRAPFTVDATAKLTVAFRYDGELVGFAGLALPRAPSTTELAWYTGCSVALTHWTMAGHADTAKIPDADKLPAHLDGDTGDFTSRLSAREFEVARYLAEGHSVLNISAILDLRTTTVRTYVRRIYAKLEVCSRIELAHRMRWCRMEPVASRQ